MLTRKEILDGNKKYRVSDSIKSKAHKRGFRIRIKYSFDDECYYVTLINLKNGAEETFYVGLLFMIKHERPFDEVIINMMNNIFLRTISGSFRGDVE
jgi:hypothetical protein